MKDSSFRGRFSLLLRFTWKLVSCSEERVKIEGNNQNVNEQEENEKFLEIDDIIIKNLDQEGQKGGQPHLNLEIIECEE